MDIGKDIGPLLESLSLCTFEDFRKYFVLCAGVKMELDEYTKQDIEGINAIWEREARGVVDEYSFDDKE